MSMIELATEAKALLKQWRTEYAGCPMDTVVDPRAVLQGMAKLTGSESPLPHQGLWLRAGIVVPKSYMDFILDPTIMEILDPCCQQEILDQGVVGVVIGCPVIVDPDNLLKDNEVLVIVKDLRKTKEPEKPAVHVAGWKWLQQTKRQTINRVTYDVIYGDNRLARLSGKVAPKSGDYLSLGGLTDHPCNEWSVVTVIHVGDAVSGTVSSLEVHVLPAEKGATSESAVENDISPTDYLLLEADIRMGLKRQVSPSEYNKALWANEPCWWAWQVGKPKLYAVAYKCERKGCTSKGTLLAGAVLCEVHRAEEGKFRSEEPKDG